MTTYAGLTYDGQALTAPGSAPPPPAFAAGATADTADVEDALVRLIAAAAYPNARGIPVKVFRGWPIPSQLDEDLAAGVVTISVYPTDSETKVTRHMPGWLELPPEAPTLTLTAAGNAVTVGGTTGRSNAVIVADNEAYVFAAYPSDTVNGVAMGLAALIPGATSAGPVVTVPGAHVAARVQGFGTAVRELKRQKRGYQVTLWCGTPEARDAVAPLVDAALASVEYLPLPDGLSARLLYERSRVSDRAEKDNLYRRDLFYSAEFSTTQSLDAARVAAATADAARFDGTPIISTAT